MPETGRRILRADARHFDPYDLQGELQPEFGLIQISYDRARGEGTYLMRMAPGSCSLLHEHRGYEDFLILEGELIDDDGTVLKAGDLISYAPGSRHESRSETGCTILVCEWRSGERDGEKGVWVSQS